MFADDPLDPTPLLDAIDEWMSGCAPHAPCAPGAAPDSSLVSRAAAPSMPRELADLRTLMCAASTAVRSYADCCGCRVQLELPDDPLIVCVSPAQLEIALTGLIRNSIDACATLVTLLGAVDEACVAIRVDDDGFYPSPVAPARDECLSAIVRWTGDLIGAAARNIIEEHGGRLDMVHRPGRGSSAYVTLPKNADGAPSL